MNPPASHPAPTAPKPNRAALAMRRRVALPLCLIAAAIALAACGGEPEQVASSGRSLEIRSSYPAIVEKVAFTDSAGVSRVIRPKASNRQLVLLNIAVVNRTSLVTPLLIDSEAAQIGDRRGERIDAIDPFAASKPTDPGDPDENLYSPFLWGEVNLDREFQVEGWMVFDVPKGLVLGSLWWDEVDSVIADFIEYRRRRA